MAGLDLGAGLRFGNGVEGDFPSPGQVHSDHGENEVDLKFSFPRFAHDLKCQFVSISMVKINCSDH